MWVDDQETPNFSVAQLDTPVNSSEKISLGEPVHICIVLKDGIVQIYINGVLNNSENLHKILDLELNNGELRIGQRSDDEYFAGKIKEVRIWGRVRTIEEINSYLFRPVPSSNLDLIGYWPLDEITDGMAPDLTYHKNHLYTGGLPKDYRPSCVVTDLLPLSQSLPVPARGTVLQFDGDNDVIVIKNPKNWGMGRYERLTLELWFNASAKGDPNRKQVIFSQGDAEAGLCIYLYNLMIHVIEWNNSYEGSAQNILPLDRSLFKTSFTDYGKWHHIALTHNEFPKQIEEYASFQVDDCFYTKEDIEFKAYLDGTLLQNYSGIYKGYKLSPVGAAYLGGLGKEGKTCFDDAYSDHDHIYFFAGQIANLGIYNNIKSVDEIAESRYFAPAVTEDLITYMPMDEGKGWTVSGWEEENLHIGTLQDRNIALVTDKSDPELINIYSHYSYPGPVDAALLWKNYIYMGRMRFAEENASVGVTFLSLHPKGIDQCYLLGRDADHRTFCLFAHPSGVHNLKSSDAVQDKRDSGIVPQPNVWYYFQIRVEDTGTRTNISAKIWPETGVMPPAPQIDAYDESCIRSISGTVGLWTAGTSTTERQYDNLRLWPNNIIDPSPSQLLLDINFEAESQVPEPDNWLDAEDRQKLPVQGGLFKQISVLGGVGGETAFGTDSTDLNIHSYYNPVNAIVNPLTWNNYIYQGRMRISDKDSGIGVIFLSRQPEGIDQYYGLVRDEVSRTFHLVAHPQNIQNVKSSDLTQDKRDSGIDPQPNSWYRFLIEVQDTGDRTRIKAKIWPEFAAISPGYVIDAYDDSCIRITSGTVGVWASGIGSKYYSSLSVCRDFLLSENFDSYSANQDPLNWRDTKENGSNDEDNSLFKTFSSDGNMVFGTKSSKDLIHSHCALAVSANWKNYTYTGRMRIGDSTSTKLGGIGVTFLSQFRVGQLANPGYYALLYNPSDMLMNRFYVSSSPIGTALPLKGKPVFNLIPKKNTWYRFLIVVEDTGSRTNIKVKIWPESGDEPADYQIDAYDDGIRRLRSGTVGVMSMKPGSNYFDDLEVVGTVFLSDKSPLESWHDVTMRVYQSGDSVDDLFKSVDLLDNAPRWVAIPNSDNNSQYPVLLRPLSKRAMEFDGLHKYLSADHFETAFLSQFTIEAWIWISPSAIRESSIISFTGKDPNGDETIVVFGIDDYGNLRLMHKQLGIVSQLSVSSGKTLQIEKFCHVAVSIKGSGTNRVSFFMDGELINTVSNLSQSNIFGSIAVRLDIGKGIDGMFSQYLHGKIKEVRIWNIARSTEDIVYSMYQRPIESADLIGYWSLGEDDADVASDLSGNGHFMRLGGLEEDRSPELIDPEPDGFWNSNRHVLDFNGTSDMIPLTYGAENAILQRRTVEVWFRVEDKAISRQKQVIYQEGDDQCGLAIYICDSSLYFGGYNLSENRWKGTWLHTDRIESGRWHHAALVLDGRTQLRDESLQAYLDGKRIDEGPASQLQAENISISLGGLRGPIKFHDTPDGESISAPGHYFLGQILSLRVWKIARTAEQIRDSIYSLPGNSPGLQHNGRARNMSWVLDHITYTWDTDISEKTAVSKEINPEDLLNLDLWWESDRVDSYVRTINDLSDKGHIATYAVGQLQPIKLPGKYALPVISLEASTMDGLAEIKRLQEQYSQPIDRLTALWYSINYMGKDDQATLFDRIFNPKGTVIEHWDYCLDQPMRWDKSGEEDRRRDSQIRSRLMGALRLSNEDLNLIVEYLSGEDEDIIELDTDYLTRLFRLSGLAGMLHFSVKDLLLALEMQGKTSVDSLADVLDVCSFAEWLNGIGLNVTDLIFLTHDANVPEGALTLYSEGDLLSMAKSLFDQSSTFLINGKSFESDLLSEAQSADIFSFLQSNGVINIIGAVTANYWEQLDLTGLLEDLASLENWMVNFDTLKAEFDKIRAGLGNEIIARLQAPSHKFIDEFGLVLEMSGGYGKDSLMTIFDGQTPETKILDMLPRVTEILELRKAIQDQILDTDGPVRTVLRNSIDRAESALYSELAGLFQVKIEMIAVASGYLTKMLVMDVSHLLIYLKDFLESGLVAGELEVCLFKLSKLIYLANAFELTAEEMEALLMNPEHFSVDNCLQPSFQDLDNLGGFKQLQSDFGDTQSKLIDLLSLNHDDKPVIEEALWDLAGWDPRQLRSLATYFEVTSYNRIPALSRLKGCFDIAQSMQAGIDLLIQLADTSSLESDEEYDFYSRQAPGLLEVLRAGYTEEEWPDAYKPVHDELAVKCRDALLDLALLKLPMYWQEYIFCWDSIPGDDVDLLKIFLGRDLQQSWVDDEKVTVSKKDSKTIEITLDENSAIISIVKEATLDEQGTATLTTSDGLNLTLITKLEKDKLNNGVLNIYRENMFRKGPDIYHEYFLLDLQVGSEMETSRIVQATAALQFYIQRCLMNLEAGFDPSTIPLQEWEWVKNYRVWEANRKVFLYPENYIEPELRDTKTPFFEDLEQELMQSDISQDSVESAYVHYLEKFAEVANLRIVGSYLHVDPEDQDGPKVLYLVGKTKDDPGTFYLREYTKDKWGERWLPWNKIDVVINSNFVTPVYAFGKLFIFWMEFNKHKKNVVNKDNSSTMIDVYSPDVKYSYFNFSKEWKPTQSWADLSSIELSENEYLQTRWQRLYAQRLVNLGLSENIRDGGEELGAMVLKIDNLTNVVRTIPEFDMSTLTWELWARFEKKNTFGWLGYEDYPTVVVEKEDCIRSCVLINYGNGSFKAEARNNVIEVEDYQTKVDAAGDVANLTISALDKINQNEFMDGAILEEDARDAAQAATFDEKLLVMAKAEAAMDAANDALSKAMAAMAAHMLATIERDKYNQMVAENLLHPGTYTDDQIAAQDLIATNAENAADAAEELADTAAEDARTKAADANDAANHALGVELAKAKWKSKNVIISFYVSGQTTPVEDVEIEFGTWDHVAVTMRTSGSQYYVTVYKNGESGSVKGPVGTSPLNAVENIVVGKQDGTVEEAFVAMMSELRLWCSERSRAEIIDNKNYRMSMMKDLFSMPLKEKYQDDPSCNMTPVKSVDLSFATLPLNGLLAGISDRERLILFFGDRIASIRNNLKDKSFIMVLEPNWAKMIQDISLSYDESISGKSKAILHLVETNGMSINDFVTSEEGFMARPTSLPERFVDESKILLKNLEGTECSFFDVNNQPGWYIVNTGDDQFLVKMLFLDPKVDIPTTAEIMKVVYGDIPDKAGDPQELVVSFEIENDNPLLTETYQITSRYTGIRKTVAIALSPVGKKIICAEDPRSLTGYLAGRITVVDLIANQIRTTDLKYDNLLLDYLFIGSRLAIALNADGNRAATIATIDGVRITLWDCQSGKDLKSTAIPSGSGFYIFSDYRSIPSLALSNDLTNPVVVCASNINIFAKYELIVWHTDGNPVNINTGHTGNLLSIAVTPDGTRCVSTSADKTIKLWNLVTNTCLKTLPEPGTTQPDHISVGGDAVAISDDGYRIAVVESGKKIRVWDLRNGIVSYDDLPECEEQIISLCFFENASGLMVVSGSKDKTVRFWNIDDGTLVNTYSGHSQMVTAVCSRNGMIASASNDRTVRLWSMSNEVGDTKTPVFTFERLSSYAVYKLSENLFTGGIDGLLSLSSQETPELDFWGDISNPNVNESLVPRDLNLNITDAINFKGDYSNYYEEVFFHIPFFIANKLNSNQLFEEAQRWYHYIFNPTANDETDGNGSSKDRYWRYLPFKKDSFESLKTLLTYGPALAAYREDPFDPHAIAALRMTAYKKAVVMKYIDNLLDWGDALFMQDSRESINEAVGLYVLAYNLLGPRPKSKIIKRFKEMGTYEDFIKDYDDSEFLTEVEKKASGSVGPAYTSPHSNIITDFCVPENEKFIGYWDLVEDRMFKIRHSQNFEGVYRQLALFSPPIEPMDLVRAVASGAGIGGALAELNMAVPHYRYPIVVGMAKEMAANAVSLGSALLDAIEKKDAEKLAYIQNTQEETLLKLQTTSKYRDIEEATKSKAAIEESRARTEEKKSYYEGLWNENWNGYEIAAYTLSSISLAGYPIDMAFRITKAILALAEIEVEVGFSGIGPHNVVKKKVITDGTAEAIAEATEAGIELVQHIAELIETASERVRRRAEWDQEKKEAESEIREIDIQLQIAQSQIDQANLELQLHEQTIQFNKDIAYFYRSKFSNEALYNWMISRLSALYFQSYKTAYDMAKSAEKCLQYDIPSTQTYITSTHWDSLRKGLLAGESLLLQIDQMEKSHLAQDSRFIEIEKTISMKNTFPAALLLLIAKGACEFKLKEEIFDQDYPGHYFRVIKTIELTVVTQLELEPYQSVNVTLIQLGNKTLLTPDINGVKYLMGKEEQSDSVRVNWRANQQVAVSRVNERDAGMFCMDFMFDNRYFPFEGTGLVSSWRLEIPQGTNPDLLANNILNIDDVLIHIRYTAKSDRGKFKTEVEKALRQ